SGATAISRTRPRTAPEASRTVAPSNSDKATRDMSLGQSLITARGAPPFPRRRGPTPGAIGSRLPLALARRPSFAGLPSSGPPQRGCRVGDPGTSLGPQALSLLAGPHPRSLSLGGPASPGCLPAGHPNTAAALGTRRLARAAGAIT